MELLNDFLSWVWARHHNELSWYVRPLFGLPVEPAGSLGDLDPEWVLRRAVRRIGLAVSGSGVWGIRTGRGITPAARGRNALNTNKKVKMNTLEKLKVHKILSALTIAIGFVLMLGKIYADSEPGAIPMLLVVLGMGWYFITRVRTRSHQK